MNVMLLKIKIPDQIIYHWHSHNDFEECLDVAVPTAGNGIDALEIALYENSIQYQDLKRRGYILEEENLSPTEYVAYLDKIRSYSEALQSEPN